MCSHEVFGTSGLPTESAFSLIASAKEEFSECTLLSATICHPFHVGGAFNREFLFDKLFNI